MAVIKPTLGRVVWFTPSKVDVVPEIPADRDGRCAAIVVYVHPNGLVNLSVFDANGVQRPKTSVPLVQEGESRPGHGYYCEWMPYQLGQASKAECLQNVVDAAYGGCSGK